MLNRMFIQIILNMRFNIWTFLLTGWHANTFKKTGFMVPFLLPMQKMHHLMILPLQALRVESKMLWTCSFEYKIFVLKAKNQIFCMLLVHFLISRFVPGIGWQLAWLGWKNHKVCSRIFGGIWLEDEETFCYRPSNPCKTCWE